MARNNWPQPVSPDATHIGTARINTAPTVSALRAHPATRAAPKPSKYRNEKVNVDGTKFDSRKESRRYFELKRKEEAGEIGDLTLQQIFLLTPQMTRDDGSIEKKSEYQADFTYVENGKFVVEDVKSDITRKKRDYVLKRKMMLHFHGITIREEN